MVKNMRISIIIAIFLLSGLSAHAQVNVSGTVKSATDGLPLPGATVLEKGTTNGVMADLDGNFRIQVQSEAAALVFSYIGFEEQTVTVGEKRTFVIELREATQLLQCEVSVKKSL